MCVWMNKEGWERIKCSNIVHPGHDQDISIACPGHNYIHAQISTQTHIWYTHYLPSTSGLIMSSILPLVYIFTTSILNITFLWFTRYKKLNAISCGDKFVLTHFVIPRNITRLKSHDHNHTLSRTISFRSL